MLLLEELLAELRYHQSPHYRSKEGDFEPQTAHLFRATRDLKANGSVEGIYVFETSPPNENHILPAQPAVYVVNADTEEDARQIHRNLWNLCNAPFIIVRLPHQIRIYTGFNYSQESPKDGLLEVIDARERLSLLRDFSAYAIDTGKIWKSQYVEALNPQQRVDKRLLRNLSQLGEVLQKNGLDPELAHALIGKYVYFSYLRHRNILSDEWLVQQKLLPQDVFTFRASVASLRILNEALEKRFNGEIFPIDFAKEDTLKDEHVSWVASVFTGDKIAQDAPELVRQLHLPFRAYDFQFIPVETLSAIYEQFIHARKEKGAIYTPEVLADYLLSEMEWAKSLRKGMRVLDPSCGSGVFLVLTYRRLIEKEMERLQRNLAPEELREVLLESIYGVERERDACFVAEFSLILTLLHYIEPRELHKNLDFQFPALHNTRIYQCDFFDPESLFEKQNLKFDWIVGNPPWVKARGESQIHANRWMKENHKDKPVGDKSVAEAFSWRVGELLDSDGLVGLILPATSLVNLKSRDYRERFFEQYEVLRITNFANLREVLFDRRGTLPAATVTYRKANENQPRVPIIHYGPLSINQVSDDRDRPWVIVINENEIQTIDPFEAQSGEPYIWKIALWGNHRDRRVIARLQYLFPNTLEEFCEQKGWGKGMPRQGAELNNKDLNKPLAKVKGQRYFETQIFDDFKPRYRFSIPHPHVLQEIKDDLFIRRGENTLYLTTLAPHVILSTAWQNFAIYSEEPFVVPPRQLVIAAPAQPRANRNYLRALAVYLSSSLVAYYLFFHVPEWGIFRQRKSIVTSEVRKIPTPDFTLTQAQSLADTHSQLVAVEKQEITRFVPEMQARVQSRLSIGAEFGNAVPVTLSGLPRNLTNAERKRVEEFSKELQARLQKLVDQSVSNVLGIPDDISLLAKEFIETRLTLDRPSAVSSVIAPPDDQDLLEYAQELRDELDSYVVGNVHHRITVTYSDELIECTIEMTDEPKPIPVNGTSIRAGDITTARLMSELSDSLKQQVSQWIYVQRGLRLFEGPRIYIYKLPRLIDWTRTQALTDANDIIGTALITAQNP